MERLRADHESQEPRPNDAESGGSDVIHRPRNPAVEAAWNSYALSFKLWAEITESAVYSGRGGYYAAEREKQKAIIAQREKRDLALYEYFEAFDSDQRDHFGEVSDAASPTGDSPEQEAFGNGE